MHGLTLPLLAFAALLVAGLVAERLAQALQLPDLVLLVLAGILLGPVTHLVVLAPGGTLAQAVLTGGALFMLYEGGRELNVGLLRRIWLGAVLLSTGGVLLTAVAVALAGHFALSMPWNEAWLLGAVLSATDPATVIPLFRQVRVPRRLGQLVVCESALNDAIGAVLTFTLLGAGTLWSVATLGRFAWSAGAGLGIGAAIGSLAAWLLPGEHGLGLLDTREHGAVLSLAVVLAAFGVATTAGGSGFMAVFAAGFVNRNRHLLQLSVPSDHQRHHDAYFDQTGVIVRLLIFTVLGTSINLGLVARLWAPALVAVAALILVARPLAVFGALPLDRIARWSWREMLFTCWVRETGVVPAALAGLLTAAGAPGAATITATVLVAILVTILLQASTTAWWARRLGLAPTDRAA